MVLYYNHLFILSNMIQFYAVPIFLEFLIFEKITFMGLEVCMLLKEYKKKYQVVTFTETKLRRWSLFSCCVLIIDA